MRHSRSLFATLLALLVVIIWPSSVSAHAVLDTSSPAPSSVLKSSPDEIRLDFNENIEETLMSIEVFDQSQQRLNIGDATRDVNDVSVVTASVPSLDNGVYVVVWRVVSADGHPISGAFPFQVGDNPTVTLNELLNRVLNGLDTQSPLGTSLSVSRFVAYMALIALVGMVFFSWNSVSSVAPVVKTWLRRSIVAFALGSLGIFLLQGPYAVGRGWNAVTDGNLLADVITTRIGIASLVRLLLVVVWATLLMSIGRISTTWWKCGFIGTSLISVTTFSVSGHPSAAALPGVFVPVDIVHLTAVSVWVGSFFAAALVRTEEGVLRLSQVGTIAMPIAVVTGVAQSWNLLDSVSDVFGTQYGRFLLTKVFIIAVCLGIGLQLRLRLKRGQATVTRMLTVEAALLVAVVAVTAFMVSTSPQRTIATTSFSATQVQSDVVVDFSIFPTSVGAAEVHVYLTPPGGSLTPVENVEMSFSLPSRSIPAIPVDLIEVGPNHWSGVMQFPYAGKWTMESRVQPTSSSTLLYTASVTVTD